MISRFSATHYIMPTGCWFKYSGITSLRGVIIERFCLQNRFSRLVAQQIALVICWGLLWECWFFRLYLHANCTHDSAGLNLFLKSLKISKRPWPYCRSGSIFVFQTKTLWLEPSATSVVTDLPLGANSWWYRHSSHTYSWHSKAKLCYLVSPGSSLVTVEVGVGVAVVP